MSSGCFWLILSLLKTDSRFESWNPQGLNCCVVIFVLCYLWSSMNWKGLSIVSPIFSTPGIWMSSIGIIKNRVVVTRKNLSSTFWLIFSFMDLRNWIHIIMFLVSVLSDWRFALNFCGNLDLLFLARRQSTRLLLIAARMAKSLLVVR